MHEFGEFAARERIGWADEGIVSAYVERFVPVAAVADHGGSCVKISVGQ